MRTDGHDEANSRLSNFTNAVKNSRRAHGCLSFVSVVELSDRGLRDRPIANLQESYQLVCRCV